MSKQSVLYILDDEGRPVHEPDPMKWALWLKKANQIVAESDFANGRVSTVFLGVDSNVTDGLPRLFETLVFGGQLDGQAFHCSTRAEALAAHALMVERVRNHEEHRSAAAARGRRVYE